MTLLALAFLIAASAATETTVPPPFAVCVTTTDHPNPRRDTLWSDRTDARNRVLEILRDGWITQGEDDSEEDYYPPTSIVKATVDGTLDDGFYCIAGAPAENNNTTNE